MAIDRGDVRSNYAEMTFMSADVPARYQVIKLVDERIPLGRGGETLSANVYRPASTLKVPALVMVLPYRKDAGIGIMYDETLRWFAARGFATVLVDFKGTGSSDGKHRPPLHADEADDGIAAIKWAAAQPWCTGNVGMWGHSYGAIMSLRVASRPPSQLKAILPVNGLANPGADFMFPGGARACHPIAAWGPYTLLNQLLPPLHRFDSSEEQDRWKRRLHEAEPWLIDLWQHKSADDPAWQERRFDPAQIKIPSLCIAGWRDIFCNGSIAAYEKIDAPKKLIVGPWMHTMPDLSPFDPWDYRPLALHWWDHWLNGADNGVMNEASVLLYVQGALRHWRAFESWPPSIKNRPIRIECENRSAADIGENEERGCSDAQMMLQSDPTVGALGGLFGTVTSGFGLPRDQHDDDMRCSRFTVPSVEEHTVLAGRPLVKLFWSTEIAPSRVVVRLSDIAPSRQSILIASGILEEGELAAVHQVTFSPTCYSLAAGHKLRITLSDADFPRLWPAGAASEIAKHLRAIELALPVTRIDEARVVEMPGPKHEAEDGASLVHYSHPVWAIERSIIPDGVKIVVGDEYSASTPDRRHEIAAEYNITASVRRDAPPSATVHSKACASVKLQTGEFIKVIADVRMTANELHAHGCVDIDGISVFEREWRA